MCGACKHETSLPCAWSPSSLNSFCELNTDGCSAFSPPCQPGQPAIRPGQDFCFCTTITVPNWSPEVSRLDKSKKKKEKSISQTRTPGVPNSRGT